MSGGISYINICVLGFAALREPAGAATTSDTEKGVWWNKLRAAFKRNSDASHWRGEKKNKKTSSHPESLQRKSDDLLTFYRGRRVTTHPHSKSDLTSNRDRLRKQGHLKKKKKKRRKRKELKKKKRTAQRSDQISERSPDTTHLGGSAQWNDSTDMKECKAP